MKRSRIAGGGISSIRTSARSARWKCWRKERKGLYIGETSRSLYERSKEHQKDKEDREDDSHPVKHWVLDHPEMSSPPKFKFTSVGSFQDPLTRQISESPRIERGGESILEMSWLASDKVGPRKLKTRRDEDTRNIKSMFQNHESDMDRITNLNINNEFF